MNDQIFHDARLLVSNLAQETLEVESNKIPAEKRIVFWGGVLTQVYGFAYADLDNEKAFQELLRRVSTIRFGV